MADYDLEIIEDRVNRSRTEFLHALDEYNSDDAKQIVDEFVFKFLKEKIDWADTTREHASEIVEQNNRFASMIASSATSVAIVGLKMQQAIYHLQIEIIGGVVNGVGTRAPLSVSPMERLQAQMSNIKKVHKDLIERGENAKKIAYEIGVRIDRIQRIATDLLLMRIVTLEAFKTKNLGVNFEDIVERFREQVKEEGTSVGLEKLGDFITEKLHDILEILGTQVPIARLLIAVKKIHDLFKPKPVKPDATNELLKLVDLMKKENAAYQALNDAYNTALDELDKIARTPLQQAS